MTPMFERTALPDGPRVISARLPGSRSLSVAVYVLAGSRLESPAQSGVAHFMEHVTFKGTNAYPTTKLLSEAIEGCGGSTNAATDRESTVYWARLPVREFDRAFGVLSELVCRPLLRANDIARERDIIVEEIRSYRDDPGQYVFNLFDTAFFGDTPLGWEIAGDEASVRGLAESDIRGFWSDTYRPANTVISVAGDVDHERIVEKVISCFGTGNGIVPGFSAAPTLPQQRLSVEHRDVAQAHVALGLPALPRDHADQWTLEMLNTILGEGSSSRLFQQLREDAGLAYDVHSFQTDYADCGTLQVYAGVDPDDLARSVQAMLGELQRMRDKPVDMDELDRARTYAAGRLELRLEESRHLSAWLGVQEALHDRVLTLDEALAELAEVTPEGIQALAQQLFRDDRLCLAVIAPPDTTSGLDEALHLPD
ncbi:MAG TPA: pitrilysin family protein [Candidatus Limnocylindrales bacterium]|nr:pitrilysin family protein [Candidatus Limnocylindrales bacterium]